MSDDLSMFGELEDAPNERMVVRAVGHVLGTCEGWFHFGGLAVVFPAIQSQHPKIKPLLEGIAAERACLAIDFYTGEVKILEASIGVEPKVRHSLQLRDLLPE